MSESGDMLDQPRLDALLQASNALPSASELHGYLTGQLTGGRRPSREEWLGTAAEQADADLAADAETAAALTELYRQTLVSLSSQDFDFSLLLAPDAAPLGERLTSLAAWCEGFLAGFGLAGAQADDAETTDTLRDFAAISQVEAEANEGEQSDADLFAIIEYVRLAVTDMFLQRNPRPAPIAPAAPTSADAPTVERAPGTTAAAAAHTPASPADLFRRGKLH